jgi:glucose-1-phosphate adenylyltransferase
LTIDRAKPAIPFGDRRIIDFVLTNCSQSNLNNPLVITQYQAAHLTRHVRRWWLEHSAFAANAEAGPACLPAPSEPYKGTADALYRNLHAIRPDTEYILVLSADHIYDMDYRELLRFHADRGADATMASIVYPSRASRQFGIVQVNRVDHISGFEEKPARPKELPGMPGKVLANMGIYVFNKAAFLDAFQRDAEDCASVHDIGRNVLPTLVNRSSVSAYRFDGYWKDVGTIGSYYDASMEWLRRLPSTHRLAGSTSVIAEGAHIHPTAQVMDSIVMRGVLIGPGAFVRRAILDENARIMAGAYIGNSNEIAVVASNSTVFSPAVRYAGELRLAN